MYWIALTVTGIFFVLLCLARREDTAPGTASLMKPFYKMAMYLYKKSCHRFSRLFSSIQVEKDLVQLHPGEARECLKTEYYVKKAALCLAVVFTGTLIGAAAKFSTDSQVILGENGGIARRNYQEGGMEIEIGTDYGQQKMDFRIEVEPRLLSEEEAANLTDAFLEVLPEYILGANASLQEVASDLKLQERYGDFPLRVSWESSEPGILGDAGQVFSAEEEREVALFAEIRYGEYKREESFLVRVVPPLLSEEEQLYQEIEELLQQSQSGSLEEDIWWLPQEWQGEKIQWRQIVEDNSLLLWGAAMVTAAAVFLLLDRDLHEQLEKRKRSLRREYPEIVHKLVLFVGAGMTIRGAFQKIAGDYGTKLRGGGRASPAYEEVLYMCRELQSGVSEGLSYEHFGKRTGLQEYIRLSTLLAQNLKRGNSTLLERLREEADKSAEERLQQSKKMGEEAGTKLLIPMVLMLTVVMAMIMIPAFSNM